ncbi:MAG: GNAT family N-acetyltransferase [Candidatus Obscuribacter sp.]|nr:GNAT family N-acetyltransferase [Candidatus Obscuribacter sp.]MBP6347989.1 GNAT family N-acetyltransferase [Candidatus Obscuribacter sp.]MBP6591442.1 GNAT family N-acetyltransferase [Candidatus Obscuribacter sp.]MBP7575132.1 GNAT family N-acetyltransferase [Candidatus Obscuribacter sp.]
MFNSNHQYAAKDRLKNGTPVIVRAIRASDKELLQQIMQAVSAESRYFRFFAAKKLLSDSELKYFTEIDFDKHMALIVSLCDEAQTPIAVGRYVKVKADGATCDATESDMAELALLVGEDYQRQGLGQILLTHLAHIAVTRGVSEFVCYIMPENSKMLRLLNNSQYPVSRLPGPAAMVQLRVGLEPRTA